MAKLVVYVPDSVFPDPSCYLAEQNIIVTNRKNEQNSKKRTRFSFKAFVGLVEHKKECGKILKTPRVTRLPCISHIII